METTDRATVNGVDVSTLDGAVEAITEDADLGAFRFRAETEWQDALKSVTTIDQFDQAGESTTPGSSPCRVRTGTDSRRADRPNAAELLLGALGSCLTVGYAAHGAAMGIELDGMRLEMEGDLDLRGFLGISEDVRPATSR